MVCLYCGKKLTVVKKLSSDEFCSPAHKQAFLQQHEKLALARLLESQGRLGSGPRRPKVDLAEVAAAAQQKKTAEKTAGKKVERALHVTDPAFGEFLSQQIGMRRYVGPVWQQPQASQQELAPAFPSSELRLNKPSASAGAVEMELEPEARLDSDVIASLLALSQSASALSESTAAYRPKQAAFGWIEPEAGDLLCPGSDGLMEFCLESAEGGFTELVPQEWRVEWDPRMSNGCVQFPLEAAPLLLPEAGLQLVAYEAGPSEAEIDTIAEGPLAGELDSLVEQLTPGMAAPGRAAELIPYGPKRFAFAQLPGAGREAMAPPQSFEFANELLSSDACETAVASELAAQLVPMPAQLPFSRMSQPSFQYDRRSRRLQFSFRLPIHGVDAVLPEMLPALPAVVLPPEIAPRLDVCSGLVLQRQSALDPAEGEPKFFSIGNAATQALIAPAAEIREVEAWTQPIATVLALPVLSRKDCLPSELRGPRAGRAVPIPILLRATLPAQKFVSAPAAPLIPSKHFPRLSVGMIPAVVEMAHFSAMSQLAGGNVDLSLGRLKRHWQEAPSDLRWIALAVPLVLGLIWYSVTPGAQRFSREANRRTSVQSLDTAEAATSTTAQLPLVPASGLLEKIVPGDSLIELKVGIMRRAAVELGDDFRQGLGDWSGEGDWARGWRYDPAGFVRPRKLALYTPTLALEDYRFEFLGQIEKKALSWVFRAADAQNYQVAKLEITRPGPVPTVELVRYAVHNGRAGPKKSIPLPMQVYMDEIYRVRVDVSGQDYITSIKGMVVDVFSDPSIARGGVGFFADAGEESRLRWVEVSHQYDFLGRLCAFLVPYSVPNSNVRTDQ